MKDGLPVYLSGKLRPITLVVVAVCAFIAGGVLAGPPVLEWSKTFGRPNGGNIYYNSPCFDGAGNTFIQVENNQGNQIIKYDIAGNPVNTVSLPDASHSYRIAVDASGNIYAFSFQYDSSWTNCQLFVIKMSASGAQIWSVQRDLGYNFEPISILVDGGGNVYVLESQWSVSEGAVHKINSSGVYQWGRTHAQSFGEGSLYLDVAGNTYHAGGTDGNNLQAFIVKYNPSGVQQFESFYDYSTGIYDFVLASSASNPDIYLALTDWSSQVQVIKFNKTTGVQGAIGIYTALPALAAIYGAVVDLSGNVFVAGVYYATDSNLAILKFNPSLVPNPAGPVIYDGGMDEGGDSSLGLDPSGNVYAVFSGVEPCTFSMNSHIYVSKYTNALTSIWMKEYSAPANETIKIVAVDGSGNVCLAGQSGGEALLLEYDSGGTEIRHVLISDPAICSFMGVEAAYKSGEIYFAGEGYYRAAHDPASGIMFKSLKTVDGTPGAVNFEYSPFDDVSPGAIVVDEGGDIFLAANYWSSTTYNQEILVARLSPTGVTRWAFTWTSGSDDMASTMGLDSDGNLLVGLGYYGNTNNLGLLKISSSGNIIWSRKFNIGSAGTVVTGMAVKGTDAFISGFVELTGGPGGYSFNGFICHVGSAGDLVWKTEYANGLYSAFMGVAIAPTGKILVTGIELSADGLSGGELLAAYTPSGSLCWAQTYSGLNHLGDCLIPEPLYVGGADGDDASIQKFTGTVDDCVALGKFDTPLVTYPNPVKGDKLNVALQLDGPADEVTVDIYDSGFKRVYSGLWKNVAQMEGGVVIDGMKKLAPGLYLLKAQAKLAGGKQKKFAPIKVVIKR